MKSYILSSVVLASGILLNSCSSNLGGEEYDVSNPYAAPDYPGDDTSPYEPAAANNSVNPAYDAPAAYEDAAPAYEAPATPTYQAPAVSQTQVHTVGRGDTLWGISKKYGVSVSAIKAANGLTSDVAVLGAKLQIPAS
ncbi:LysM peptidoglycan-binding domain-containing protein [Luteolibacter sp. AS25]|uniref:LysM peptidoglycan-binding domain-containing protein n=1 Tax=Luteolibacter sp. AS25 TaxID=3135776 RepID=UPI00398AE777